MIRPVTGAAAVVVGTVVVVAIPAEAEADQVVVLDRSLVGALDGPLGGALDAALEFALDALVAGELTASAADVAALEADPTAELAAEAVVAGSDDAADEPASPVELEQEVAINAPITMPVAAAMRRRWLCGSFRGGLIRWIVPCSAGCCLSLECELVLGIAPWLGCGAKRPTGHGTTAVQRPPAAAGQLMVARGRHAGVV